LNAKTSANHDVGRAVWWLDAGQDVDTGLQADLGLRRLTGEIRLDKALKPSSALAHHFALDVRLDLISQRCSGDL
jgi:hypothetical protein